MSRKLIIIMFIFAFSASLFNCSDDNARRRQQRSPGENAKRLQDELNLTDEQTKQVEKIYLDSQEEMAKARENFEGDRSQMREMMMASRKKINHQIEEVLNEDQKLKFHDYLDEQQEKMQQRMKDRKDRDQ